MSPRGNPGKPRNLSPEAKGRILAGIKRHKRKQKQRIADLAFKKASVEPSPAVWLTPYANVSDYAFVENGCDEQLLRDLERGVVYASSVGCCHEHPFEEITINVIAAVEKDAIKHGRKRKTLPKPVVRMKAVPVTRTGPSLTAVVDEMFPSSRTGKPLLQVVSELYDSLKGAA